MFFFFLVINRKGVITFSGSSVDIKFDVKGISGKECFRLFDDGKYNKGEKIITKHPNIVKSVITGKKGWGLWRKQWSEGIGDCLFTREEILSEFIDKGIVIPDSLLKEFDDFILKYKIKRYDEYLKK